MTAIAKNPLTEPAMANRSLVTMGCAGGFGHEQIGHTALARRLAAVLGYSFAGDAAGGGAGLGAYLVPRQTLVARDSAAFGIESEMDFFGGLVPHEIMATKAIFHPLPPGGGEIALGWPERLAVEAVTLTLKGFTAFTPAQAAEAGELLLRSGSLRIKAVHADGAKDQAIVKDRAGFDEALSGFVTDGWLSDTLVLEENLEDAETFSVGQVRLPGITLSYCGTQFLTKANDGSGAYGGSTLDLVRGGYDALAACCADPLRLEAVALAQAYDDLAGRHIPGLLASRRNYDIAGGHTADGSRRLGVLEQSWRIGGASGAEIIALEAFKSDPALTQVRTCTREVYGAPPPLPDGAMVYFSGNDPSVGPLTKYAYLETGIFEGKAG